MTTRDSATQQLTLDNGLAVTYEVDRRQPLVAIEARILGGLRGEGRYLGTGITHFLEHMIFKGTETRGPGTIDQEVRRYGGTINAFTSHDYTGITLFVESKYLKDALGMLSDILQHSTFPSEEFEKERAVVISEIQMNKDDPDRRVRDLFWGRHFLQHPYRHPILGYQSMLERLTVDDMRGYYHAQYIPNNVVVACVGDLDAATFPSMIRETFGSWERKAPYQIVAPEELPPLSPKEQTEELEVQAGYMIIGFPSVRLAHPDLYPLDVLASILGQGRSSRLYEEVVRKQQLAQVVSAGNYTPEDPGAFTIYVRTDPDKIGQARQAVLDQVSRVVTQGVTEQELQKAKRQVQADYVFQHQTVESKADELASSLALTGDPNYARRYVEGIERVTREQVQAVAGKYLDPSKMTLAVIQPPGTRAVVNSQDTEAPLNVTKTMLDNGLTVLIGVDHHLPLGTVLVIGRGGVRIEDERTQGVSNLSSQLLTKGTTHRTASEIASLVESLGASVSAFSGRDLFGVSLDLLSEDVPQGLGLMHELITDSTFPEQELELQRQLVLKELAARDDDLFDRASRMLRRLVFLKHPYRFDPMGAPDSVQRITRADCLRFAKERLAAKNLVVAVFGDIDGQTTLNEVKRRFGALPTAGGLWPALIEAEPLDTVRQEAVQLPKEQSVILLGFRGTRVAAPDRDAVEVFTAILSGMSGRLFQTVREQQGLAYTLGAGHTAGWDPGVLSVYAATRPEEQQRTLDALLEQLQRIVDEGVTDEELSQAKRYLIGSYRMELQRLSGLARRAAVDELYGVGYDAWQQYEARINAVSLADVNAVAKRYVRLSQRAQVMIGPNPVQAAPNTPSAP